jgi:excisionase family DNA binding protein
MNTYTEIEINAVSLALKLLPRAQRLLERLQSEIDEQKRAAEVALKEVPKPRPPSPNAYLTVRDVAARLNISRQNVYKLVGQHKGPACVHVGTRLRFSELALQKYEEERTTGTIKIKGK